MRRCDDPLGFLFSRIVCPLALVPSLGVSTETDAQRTQACLSCLSLQILSPQERVVLPNFSSILGRVHIYLLLPTKHFHTTKTPYFTVHLPLHVFCRCSSFTFALPVTTTPSDTYPLYERYWDVDRVYMYTCASWFCTCNFGHIRNATVSGPVQQKKKKKKKIERVPCCTLR
jgi:hypothetical protein